MTAYNIDDSSSGSGASFSNTRDVVANNDTITWTVGGFVGDTSLSKSDSNCTATLSWTTVPDSGANNGTAQITINNFTRSPSTGSYSATITGTGKDGNTQITRTATISGDIGATTGTIAITGMDGNNAFEAGDTATVSWTSNDVNFNGGYNSSGGGARFSPGTGSNTLSGTSGSFTTTCESSTAADGVWESNVFTLRFSTSSSTQLDTSNNVVLFASANAGTATTTLSNDAADGTFTLTTTTTATSPGVLNYRFFDGNTSTGTLIPGSTFSTTNTINLDGTYRGRLLTGQVREEISTNDAGSPVYDSAFTSDGITVAYVATDATIPQMTVASSVDIFPDIGNTYYITNDNTTTSPTVQLSGLDSNQEYALTNDFNNDPDQTGVIVEGTIATGNTSGNISVTNSNILTVVGGGYSWYPWTRRPTSTGGDNTWVRCTIDGFNINRVVFIREDALITPTIESVSLRIDSADYSKVVPIVELSDASAPPSEGGDLVFGYSSTDSTPTATFTHPDNSGTPATLFYSGNVNFDKTVGTIYVSVRRESTRTDAVSTRNYDSITFSSSNYYATPGGANLSVYLNNNNNPSFAGYVGDGNTEIRLYTSDTATEVVSLEGLSNPSISVVDKEDSASTLASLDSSVTVQTQYGIDITSGSTAGTPVLTVGDNVGNQFLPIGDTTDTINLVTSELPSVGNQVNYEVWRRQLVANGGDGTKQYPSQAALESEFFARRLAPADDTITVTGVRQTLANNHSTDLVLTIADGNSSTDYQLYSQGAVYDTRVGNGILTATNPGELPTAGNTRNYNIQARQTGTSDTYQNASGTGTSFTLGRLAAMDLGGPFTVPINSGYQVSAQILIDGAVGSLSIALSGANTQFRIKPSGGSFGSWINSGTTGQTVSEGGTLQVRNNAASTYSTNTVATLTLTQDSVTVFSDTFTITTSSDPGGGGTGGGGTGGTYGLRVQDASGNILLDTDDAVTNHSSINGPIAVQITTGNSSNTANLPTGQTGNVALILNSMGVTSPQDIAEATVNGSVVTVTTMATRTSNKTFNVLVLNS